MHSPLDRGIQKAVGHGSALTQDNITGNSFAEEPGIIGLFYSQTEGEHASRDMRVTKDPSTWG